MTPLRPDLIGTTLGVMPIETIMNILFKSFSEVA